MSVRIDIKQLAKESKMTNDEIIEKFKNKATGMIENLLENNDFSNNMNMGEKYVTRWCKEFRPDETY